MKTVLQYLVEAVERHPTRVMFRHSGGTHTYSDVANRIAAGIAQFEELNIRAGDRIICFTDRTIPLSHFLLTAGFLRVAPASISPVFSKEYLRSLAQQSASQAIFTTPSMAQAAESADCGIPVVSYVAPRGMKNRSEPPPSVRPFAERSDTNLQDVLGQLKELAAGLPLENAFLIQPTSGSTGIPKLVVRNHYAFARYAKFVGDEVERVLEGAPFRMLAVNALTHAFACHMFTMGMRFGAEIVVPDELDVNASLEDVRNLDPHVLPMTPRVLRSFVRQQQSKKEPPGTRLFGPSARLVLSAGGRGDPDTFRRLKKEGIEVIEFYGSSEASIIACTRAGEWRDGYAGHLVPDVETKLSRQGELLVLNPGLMIGYYGDSEMSHLVLDEDGFYRTGDLARIEEDGKVQVFGRRRDVFGTPEGSNIYPERLENLLESQEWVEQAFLVGDGLPFITAHLVVQPNLLAGKDRTREDLDVADPQSVRHGFISPQEYEDLYLQVGEILATINQGLEIIEQVVAFALYHTRFTEDCYRSVTGKVQRTRTNFIDRYGSMNSMLYADLEKNSPMLVPPRERRYSVRSGARLQAIADPEASTEIDNSIFLKIDIASRSR